MGHSRPTGNGKSCISNRDAAAAASQCGIPSAASRVRLAFLIGGAGGPAAGRTDLAAFAQASGTTFTAFVLVITAGFLLTIPVGRTRLLFAKVLVSSTVLVVGILAAVAIICLHLSWAAALGTMFTVLAGAPLARRAGS